jgi:hypothetical protein
MGPIGLWRPSFPHFSPALPTSTSVTNECNQANFILTTRLKFVNLKKGVEEG